MAEQDRIVNAQQKYYNVLDENGNVIDTLVFQEGGSLYDNAGKKNTVYANKNGSGGGEKYEPLFSVEDIMSVSPSSVGLDRNTGKITVKAPSVALNNPTFKKTLDDTLSVISQNYKANPDYKYALMESSDETKTSEEWIEDINNSIGESVKQALLFEALKKQVREQDGVELSDEDVVRRRAIALDYTDSTGETVKITDKTTQSIPESVINLDVFKNLEGWDADTHQVTWGDLKKVWNRGEIGEGGLAEDEDFLELFNVVDEYFQKKDFSDSREYAEMSALRDFIYGKDPDSGFLQGVSDVVSGFIAAVASGAAQFDVNAMNFLEGVGNLGANAFVTFSDMVAGVDAETAWSEATKDDTVFTRDYLAPVLDEWKESFKNDAAKINDKKAATYGVAAALTPILMQIVVGNALGKAAAAKVNSTAMKIFSRATSGLGDDVTRLVISNVADATPEKLAAALRAGTDFALSFSTPAQITAAVSSALTIIQNGAGITGAFATIADLGAQTVIDVVMSDSAKLRKFLEGNGSDEEKAYILEQVAGNAAGWAAGVVVPTVIKEVGSSNLAKVVNAQLSPKIYGARAWFGQAVDNIKTALHHGDVDWLKKKYDAAAAASKMDPSDIRKVNRASKLGTQWQNLEARRIMRAAERKIGHFGGVVRRGDSWSDVVNRAEYIKKEMVNQIASANRFIDITYRKNLAARVARMAIDNPAFRGARDEYINALDRVIKAETAAGIGKSSKFYEIGDEVFIRTLSKETNEYVNALYRYNEAVVFEGLTKDASELERIVQEKEYWKDVIDKFVAEKPDELVQAANNLEEMARKLSSQTQDVRVAEGVLDARILESQRASGRWNRGYMRQQHVDEWNARWKNGGEIKFSELRGQQSLKWGFKDGEPKEFQDISVVLFDDINQVARESIRKEQIEILRGLGQKVEVVVSGDDVSRVRAASNSVVNAANSKIKANTNKFIKESNTGLFNDTVKKKWREKALANAENAVTEQGARLKHAETAIPATTRRARVKYLDSLPEDELDSIIWVDQANPFTIDINEIGGYEEFEEALGPKARSWLRRQMDNRVGTLFEEPVSDYNRAVRELAEMPDSEKYSAQSFIDAMRRYKHTSEVPAWLQRLEANYRIEEVPAWARYMVSENGKKSITDLSEIDEIHNQWENLKALKYPTPDQVSEYAQFDPSKIYKKGNIVYRNGGVYKYIGNDDVVAGMNKNNWEKIKDLKRKSPKYDRWELGKAYKSGDIVYSDGGLYKFTGNHSKVYPSGWNNQDWEKIRTISRRTPELYTADNFTKLIESEPDVSTQLKKLYATTNSKVIDSDVVDLAVSRLKKQKNIFDARTLYKDRIKFFEAQKDAYDISGLEVDLNEAMDDLIDEVIDNNAKSEEVVKALSGLDDGDDLVEYASLKYMSGKKNMKGIKTQFYNTAKHDYNAILTDKSNAIKTAQIKELDSQLDAYKAAKADYKEQVAALRDKLKAGEIDKLEYNVQLKGLDDKLKSAGITPEEYKKKLQGIKGKLDGKKIEKLSSQWAQEGADWLEERIMQRYGEVSSRLAEKGSDFVDYDDLFGKISAINEEIAGAEKAADVVKTYNAYGVEEYVRLSPTVADMITTMPPALQRGPFGKIQQAFVRVFRMGTTGGLVPGSLVRQGFRDTGNALVLGDAWMSNSQVASLLENFGNTAGEWLEREMPDLWESLLKESDETGETVGQVFARREMARGAANVKSETESQLYRFTRNERIARNADGIYDEKVFNNIRTKAESFQRKTETLNDMRETYLRERVYNNALAKGISEGMSLPQARRYAEFLQAEATTNFSRTTYHFANLSRTTPYLASAINGSKSFWRLYAFDPVGVTTRIVGGYVVPMMALTNLSLSNEENKRIYKQIPEYQKKDNLVFVVDGQIFTVPVPQEISSFVAPIQSMIENMYNANDHSFDELLLNDMVGFSPLDLDGFINIDADRLLGDDLIKDHLIPGVAKISSQLMPPLAKSGFMAVTGVDPYTMKDIDASYTTIDPETGEKVVIDYKSGALAKKISELFGDSVSAPMAQAVLHNLMGTNNMTLLDGLIGLGEGVFAKDWEDLRTTGLSFAESFTAPLTVELYGEKSNIAWNRTVNQLTKEKQALLSSESYKNDINALNSADLTDKARKEIESRVKTKREEFQNKVLEASQRLVKDYSGTFDRNKFAAVISLMNFESGDYDNELPSNKYASYLNSQEFQLNKAAAVETMARMGFKSPNDFSIFGYYKQNNDGSITLEYNSPLTILNFNLSNAQQDKIALATIRDIVNENKLYDKHQAITKQIQAIYGNKKKLSKDDYSKIDAIKTNWNAEVFAAIAPYVSQMTPEAALNNKQVRDYMYTYIEVPDSWEVNNKGRYVSLGSRGNKKAAYYESWLKTLFSVNDIYKGQY